MANFYHPNQSQLSNAPLCCCCIPTKFIVLIMQAAALIYQIYNMCTDYSRDVKLFQEVLLAVYIAFTFGIFFIEHKSLMSLHCVFGLVFLFGLLAICTLQFFDVVVEKSDTIPIYNLPRKFYPTGVKMIVGFIYIGMCCELVNVLEKKALLPTYVTTVQQHSYNTEYIPEPKEKGKHSQPTIYPLL